MLTFAEAAALGAGGMALIVAAYALWRSRRPTPGTAGSMGSISVPSGFKPRGRVVLDAHVHVQATSGGPQDQTHLDVPTHNVDRLLDALTTAGFEARDTGLTVDSDEGEEALTTIALDLESGDTGSRQDLLVVAGDMVFEDHARLPCRIEVRGGLRMGAESKVYGDIDVAGDVTLGPRARVAGALVAGGDVEWGAGARAGRVEARGNIWLEDPERGTRQRLTAASFVNRR